MKNKKIPGIKELRPICQPANKFADTIILVYVIRHFSIYITRLFLHTKITANQISSMSLLFGLTGSFLFIVMQPWYIFVGSICLIVHTLLDFVDGEVARYGDNSSLTGKYLDDVNHAITVPILLLCTSFGVFGELGNILVLFFGSLAAVCEAVGQNVHWGYPNRILYSELLNSLVKYKSNKNMEFTYYVIKIDEKSTKDKIAKLFLWIHSLISRRNIFQKLYEKIWFENRIVNIVIVIGLIIPILLNTKSPDLYVKLFSLVLIIYGINRPLVLLQRYLTNIMFNNKTLENEMNNALNKLKEFKNP